VRKVVIVCASPLVRVLWRLLHERVVHAGCENVSTCAHAYTGMSGSGGGCFWRGVVTTVVCSVATMSQHCHFLRETFLPSTLPHNPGREGNLCPVCRGRFNSPKELIDHVNEWHQ
jgi:hypothetical protein